MRVTYVAAPAPHELLHLSSSSLAGVRRGASPQRAAARPWTSPPPCKGRLDWNGVGGVERQQLVGKGWLDAAGWAGLGVGVVAASSPVTCQDTKRQRFGR